MASSLRKHVLTNLLLPLALGACTQQASESPTATFPNVTLPDMEMRTKSSNTGRKHDLYVRLPANYARNQKKTYPVLYVLDGQWDFKLLDSIYGGLHYDKFVPEMIIVGVTYPGDSPDYEALRAKDYTPAPVMGLLGSGDGPKFLAFFKEELIPLIETEYRADGSRRTLMGSSFGGLFTLYAMFTETELFSGYVTASPAVSYAGEIAFGVSSVERSAEGLAEVFQSGDKGMLSLTSIQLALTERLCYSLSMVRVHYFRAHITCPLANALNAESGQAYTDALVRHWRIYRRHGHWLSRKAASRLQDAEFGPATLLHSHSLDAAREGFYNACKTARECRKQGLDNKYPFRRKRFRPTVWKNTAIRKDGDTLLLSLARGNEPIRVRLPDGLCNLPAGAFREVKLVYDRSGWYEWHVAVEDGREPEDAPGNRVVAVDPGEIHPLALTDGGETLIVTARELRAIKQWRNKKLAEIQHKQAAKVKGSRAWWRLQRAKNKLLAKTRQQQRDVEHKASRAAAEWVREREAGKAAFGDVRDVGDGKRLHRKSQQKVSQWTHGKVRAYFTYKAEEFGIEVVMQDEAHTTRTCPGCKRELKPRGRAYVCPVCGLRAHRDAVGAANILSLYLEGEMGHVQPTEPKYRQPFRKACPEREPQVRGRRKRPRRSPEDTGQVAAAERRLSRRKSVEVPHIQ